MSTRACAAGGELLLVFLDADAALCAMAAALMRLAMLSPSVPEKMPAMAALRTRSVLPCGDASAVGDLDVLQIARRGVREEVAEALGHLDVGRDLDVLLVRERGQVDGVLHDAELQVVAHLHGELDADGLLRLVGRSGDVRREDDVVELEEG